MTQDSSSFNPGDVLIDSLVLNSPRGSLEMASIFMSCSVFESIYTPGIVASIEVLDSEDYLGTLKLSGDETVFLSFRPPGGKSNDYTFSLNSVDMVDQLGSMKAKIYKLSCVGKEALKAQSMHISKSYNTQISSMIEDVLKNFLGASRVEVEATRGVQKFISPNIRPYKLIDQLRRRAVSMNNKSSNFLLFENVDGLKFKTIEGMFKEGIVKSFKQVDTVGTSIPQSVHDNILSYTLERLTSASDRINQGSVNQTVSEFDIRTNKYVTKNKKPQESDYTFGGAGAISSAFFRTLFGAKPGRFSFISKDSSLPETYMTDASVDKSAYLGNVLQNNLKLEVFGDTVLKAGTNIYATIPKKVSTTGSNGTEVLVNGKFLLARVHHKIARPEARPRYTCALDCLKGSYDQGV